MGRSHFCKHLDTSESSLEIKVLQQFTVDGGVTHILLIGSQTLCIRYSYARIQYAYVIHTLAYSTPSVTNATLTVTNVDIRAHTSANVSQAPPLRRLYVIRTLFKRFSYIYHEPPSIAWVKLSKVVRISFFSSVLYAIHTL